MNRMFRRSAPSVHNSATLNTGFTLLELLVSTAVLVVIFNICASLLLSGQRLTALNTLTLDRMRACTELRARFTDSVHEAVSLAPGVGTHQTGQDKAVLVLPSRDGHRRWLLLGDLLGDGYFRKAIIAENGAGFDTEFETHYGPRMSTIQFHYNADPLETARLVTLDLGVRPEEGERSGRVPVHRYMAALGGIASTPEGTAP